MKADTLLTAVVALCCVLAIGATSTTLDSTVSTDPEDVTEVGYDVLPIGTEQAKDLDAAIDGERSASPQSGSSSSSSADSESQSGSQSAASKPAENGKSGSKSKPGDGGKEQHGGSQTKTKQKQSGGQGTERSGNSDSKSGSGGTPEDPTLLERLLSLLRDLFDALLTVLPFAVLAVSLAVTARYRDRLLSRVAPTRSNGGPAGIDRRPRPQNDVASAWFEMVESLDLADRRDLTPREYADAARRRGADGDAARRLTELFEEVRYGGARVTDERRRRAEECLREIRTQLEVRR